MRTAPKWIRRSAGAKACARRSLLARVEHSQCDVIVVPGGGHCEVETVERQRELDVCRRKARPLSGHHLAIALAFTQWLQQRLEIDAGPTDGRLDELRARVVFGKVSRSDQRDRARAS